MFRLITAMAMILMPIISVSTGTGDSDSIIRTRDILDQKGCTRDGYCPGAPPPPFAETHSR
jgi:hypothetical protein